MGVASPLDWHQREATNRFEPNAARKTTKIDLPKRDSLIDHHPQRSVASVGMTIATRSRSQTRPIPCQNILRARVNAHAPTSALRDQSAPAGPAIQAQEPGCIS
jgi:hypothetical protein